MSTENVMDRKQTLFTAFDQETSTAPLEALDNLSYEAKLQFIIEHLEFHLDCLYSGRYDQFIRTKDNPEQVKQRAIEQAVQELLTVQAYTLPDDRIRIDAKFFAVCNQKSDAGQ